MNKLSSVCSLGFWFSAWFHLEGGGNSWKVALITNSETVCLLYPSAIQQFVMGLCCDHQQMYTYWHINSVTHRDRMRIFYKHNQRQVHECFCEKVTTTWKYKISYDESTWIEHYSLATIGVYTWMTSVSAFYAVHEFLNIFKFTYQNNH